MATLLEVADLLNDSRSAAPQLREWGVIDTARGHANLVEMAQAGITLDLMAVLCGALAQQLPQLSDPGMTLNNLQRFVSASRSPLALGTLFERDPAALPILLRLFSTSQHLSELLIQEPESYDLLRLTEGQPVARDLLVEEICSETLALDDDRDVMRVLRRFKRRETLRIAYGDIVRNQRFPMVASQISYLADALCEAAVRASRQLLVPRFGLPRTEEGHEARFAILALGKLGGAELNYSSDIDLIFLYDGEGETDGAKVISNPEYFDRLGRSIIKLLTEPTDLGSVYRVDLRLRPEGSQGPMIVSRESALRYYDEMGRTWERQAFVKARAIAGDLALGSELLQTLESWIYRRYLTRADITGIKALKRRIDRRTLNAGDDARNVKTGHGGIRDIEFTIQFLQLLNGGDLPGIRSGNTLEAMGQLEQAGCLRLEERAALEHNYVFLRQIEHRLQLMFDLQTHNLPTEDEELCKLAIRAGYAAAPREILLEQFRQDMRRTTEQNRQILNHLLHDAFEDEGNPEPVVDLVLDPEPSAEQIQTILAEYGCRDAPSAYRNLTALARESIPFLSTRRCRHFLASIVPRLMRAIAETPDPDATLVDLSRISDSLGGKGVLWELFSYSEPSLHLYVRLCAASPYLSGILTSNPGMMDELMDSLMLDRLPDIAELQEVLDDLVRGAQDVEPILHGYKNSLHLRVGVRDILGKEDIQATTATLSDIAETCLQCIALREYSALAEKFGVPSPGEGTEDEEPLPELDIDHRSPPYVYVPTLEVAPPGSHDQPMSHLVIIAMGKLGGREPNYHSDLDIVFLYDCQGNTRSVRNNAATTTTNQHFFSELGRRIIKVSTQLGPYGRLYEVDTRLRPTGKSGALAISFAEFARYFANGQGQLWERQALCKARPIFGTSSAQQAAMQLVHGAILQAGWNGQMAREIYDMRMRLEETAAVSNLKRGPGGTVDIEFTVQMLQLRYAAERGSVLVPGTLDALVALEKADCLTTADAAGMRQSYRFLRSIEARLRLMNTTARHDLPDEPRELEKLAYLLGRSDPAGLVRECQDRLRDNRARFARLFADAMRSG